MIYISGPMSGYEDFNRPAFARAAAALRELGHQVVSPPEVTDSTDWIEAMRADIKALCDCTAIAMLPGWTQSRGAQIELRIARELGMQELYIGWTTCGRIQLVEMK